MRGPVRGTRRDPYSRVMAGCVYLHIGAPKSGTTYLQTLLWQNQTRLRDHGTLLPGRRPLDHNDISTWTRSVKPGAQHVATTDRLLAQIHAWDGPVILSCEWFTMAAPAQIAALVSALNAPDVRVIFTARDLTSAVPGAWQETAKLGTAKPLSAFVADLDTGVNPRWCWQTLDPSVALPPWCDVVGTDHVTVVTVPPRGAGPDLLWQRFCAACDLDPTPFDTTTATANESVGAESARFLELVGPSLREALRVDESRWYVPYRWIRELLAHDLLVPRGGRKIALEDAARDRLGERALVTQKWLGASGVRVLGDLAELDPSPARPEAVAPEDVSTEDVLDIALDVIPTLLGKLRDEHDRAERARRETTRLRQELAANTKKPSDSTGAARLQSPRALTSALRSSAGRLRRRVRATLERRDPQ